MFSRPSLGLIRTSSRMFSSASGSIPHLSNSIAAKLPTVKLDTTLAELYKQASPEGAQTRLAHVHRMVSCGLDLGASLPRNKKFIYQDGPFNTVPISHLTAGNAGLRRSLATKYLGLIAQRDAFISGDDVVVFFHIDQSPGQRAHDREEARDTMAVLGVEQRPELVFCPGPSKIPIRQHGIGRIAYKCALDELDGYPLAMDLETHWFLNSKAALAWSGLPTPRTGIIEAIGHCPAKEACCEACTAENNGSPFVPVGCTGPRSAWLREQTDRVISAIRKEELPFVVKSQQAFGGAGTWVVESQREKTALLEEFSSTDSVLRKLFSLVAESNHHLKPGSILLCRQVENPIGNFGLTFFVKDNGEAIFMAVSEQVMGADNAWVGSTINYTDQESLREKFTPLMGRIAEWLGKRHGYHGPVGADVPVLETRTAGETESNDLRETAHHVVDLNVRTTGSMYLPLLRGHFTSRGLDCASSFSVAVKGGRDGFIEKWRGVFESGRMVILSWYEDTTTGRSMATLAIGAEDEEALRDMTAHVNDTVEEVTF